MQICSQDWVRDRCLQLPDDLCKQGFLLDNYLPAQQAQHLLRLICHTAETGGAGAGDTSTGRNQQPDRVIARLISELDEWSLRASMIDIKLMYLLEKKGGESVNSWLEDVSKCIVEAFKLGESNANSSGSSSRISGIKQEEGVEGSGGAAAAAGSSGDEADDGDRNDEDNGDGEPRRKKIKLEPLEAGLEKTRVKKKTSPVGFFCFCFFIYLPRRESL